MKRFSSTLREKKSEARNRAEDNQASGENKKKTYEECMKLVGFGDLRRSLGETK